MADTSLRIFVGILLAPELLDIGIASINFKTSSEEAGVRNIEFRLGLCNVWKKNELKWLATRSESEVTVPSISRDIGLAEV